MSNLPVIEVFHLPSSASFYAAICQPLGIYYLSCTPAPKPSSASSSLPLALRSPILHFGIPSSPNNPTNETLFTIRESPNPIRSILTIDAFSPAAVTRFHARAIAANIIRSTNLIQHNPEESIAKTTDLDGNMVEAKYHSRRSAGGTRIWETAASPREARRVLDWQKDVARSVNAAASNPDNDRGEPDARSVVSGRQVADSRRGSDPPRLLRRETISTYQYQPREPARAERLVSGMSNQTLVGTLLGAAAGAAVAYAMVKDDDPAPRGPLERRNSLPERPRLEKSYQHGYATPGRVVEIEGPRSRRGGSEVGSGGTAIRGGQMVRYRVQGRDAALAGIDEGRSVHHRSQAGRDERKGGSVVSRSSKHSHSSSRSHREREMAVLPPVPEVRTRSRSRVDGKGGSKGGRSSGGDGSEASTVRPRARSHAATHLTSDGRGGGRGERKSDVSARMVPLPESRAGSSVARRSVARTVVPEDSISSVGMRNEIQRRRTWM